MLHISFIIFFIEDKNKLSVFAPIVIFFEKIKRFALKNALVDNPKALERNIGAQKSRNRFFDVLGRSVGRFVQHCFVKELTI